MIPGSMCSPTCAIVSATTLAGARAIFGRSRRRDLRMITSRRPRDACSSASSISAKTSSIERSAWIADELSRRPVVLDERLRLLVVDLEPARDRLRSVVLAPLLPRPAAQPSDGVVVRDVEEEDRVEAPADPVEHRVERLGLREGAREAVEDEPVLGVLGLEPFPDQLEHQVVGDELAAREDRLHSAAERRPRRDRRAKHVAGRDVRNLPLLRDPRRLRALAGPLRAQDQDVHRSAT